MRAPLSLIVSMVRTEPRAVLWALAGRPWAIRINPTGDDCASCNGHAVVPHSWEPDSQEGFSHAGTRSRGVQFRARGNSGYAARERPQLRGRAHRAARRRD